jgi:IgGFc binding protein
MKYFIPLILGLLNLSVNVHGQRDTEFWFVAPDVLQNLPSNYDRPTFFRVSTYDQPATVTITQPANSGFATLSQSIPANSTHTFQFLTNMDQVENAPANTILNKGFLIRSTASISMYYEVLGQCQCNPEIFSLKGKNALGKSFYVPFQTTFDNSETFPQDRWSAFDIVATENNTQVTINPTKALLGHPANQPFTITLQRGQTWSGRAMSNLAEEHPAGTKITATKPIAVTIKDDLVNAIPYYSGDCRDLIGDQIIPVDKIGTKYVIQEGY